MPRSLVLITVDCLRADHAGFMGYRRNTTPFLDGLAPVSTLFLNAIVAGAPTYYSVPAIMASRPPLALGRTVIGIAPGEITVASTLQQSGYATGAFLAANPYLSTRFGYDIGFDTFRDFLDATPDGSMNGEPAPAIANQLNTRLAEVCHRLGPLGAVYDELYFRYCQSLAARRGSSLDSLRRFPSADVIVDEAGAWLENVGTDCFFLWLHFMDPHSPYYPNEKALELMGETADATRAVYANSYWNRGDINSRRLRSRREEILRLYDAGIRWVDFNIGRLLETLKRLHLWDDCLVAVTADHGEEFLDHGGRYHSPAKLTEELLHVPLLLHDSKNRNSQIHSEPFSLLDLAPTLLEALDIPRPITFRGTGLRERALQNPSAQVAISESISTCKNPFELGQRTGPRMLSVRDAIYKLVLDFSSNESNMFNLRDDPKELNPLPDSAEIPVRRRLLDCALQHISQSIGAGDADQRLDALLRELRLE